MAFAERLEQSHTRSVVRASAAGLQLRSACSQQQSSGGLSAAVAAAAAALPIADMPDLGGCDSVRFILCFYLHTVRFTSCFLLRKG